MTAQRLAAMQAASKFRYRTPDIKAMLDEREEVMGKKQSVSGELKDLHSRLDELNNKLTQAGIDDFVYYGKVSKEDERNKSAHIKVLAKILNGCYNFYDAQGYELPKEAPKAKVKSAKQPVTNQRRVPIAEEYSGPTVRHKAVYTNIPSPYGIADELYKKKLV